MTKVILDTNIIVSALVFSGKIRQILDMAFAGEFEMVSCEELEKETLRILVEKFGVSFQDLILAKDLFKITKKHTLQTPYPQISRDKNDNYLLALIEVSKADILVTGDKDLLVLEGFEGCRIVKAGKFLNLNY